MQVHTGEHLSQDGAPHQVMAHQLQALDNSSQLQHHLHASLSEHGLPSAYTAADMAAWQHGLAHSGLHVPSYLGAPRGEVSVGAALLESTPQLIPRRHNRKKRTLKPLVLECCVDLHEL